jgi:hypothetical protein
MKTLPGLKFVRIFSVTLTALALAGLAGAAGRKDAHVTQVIRDVKVLAKAGARPAAVNDSVHEGQAVRTGGESRAELTFADQTITRLGANSVFTFGQGAKEFDLSNGAALIVVPKEAGTVRINTAAATAAVTGFVALVESHAKGINKFMIIEGEACVKRKRGAIPTEPCTTLHAGDMLIIQPGTRGNGQTRRFDIKKTVESALLITEFGKLPKWALDDINGAIDGQNAGGGPPGGPQDPTGLDTIDQGMNAKPSSTPKYVPPPGPPPGRANRRPPGS